MNSAHSWTPHTCRRARGRAGKERKGERREAADRRCSVNNETSQSGLCLLVLCGCFCALISTLVSKGLCGTMVMSHFGGGDTAPVVTNTWEDLGSSRTRPCGHVYEEVSRLGWGWKDLLCMWLVLPPEMESQREWQRGSELSMTFLSFCFLSAEPRGPAGSYSCHCDFSTVMTALSHQKQKITFPPRSRFSQVFCCSIERSS